MPIIRDAIASEGAALEALQRRSSDVWVSYREQLGANPDAIELPQHFIDNGWVRVALDDDRAPIGFSVVIPGNGRGHELDGLFVEPAYMLCRVGRALVEDADERTRAIWGSAAPGQELTPVAPHATAVRTNPAPCASIERGIPIQ